MTDKKNEVPEARLAYRTQEVARFLGVSNDIVVSWIHAGRLKGIRVGQGEQRMHFIITKKDLDHFLSVEPGPGVQAE